MYAKVENNDGIEPMNNIITDSLKSPQTNYEKIPVRLNSKINPGSPQIKGRFSISSYSNLSNISGAEDYQKWRYRLSFNADKLLNSNLSIENYTTFSYRANQWNEISGNLGKAVRVYSLAATYNFSDQLSLSAGRKIYSKFSNIGAVDGLEIQAVFNAFSIGVVAGSRPNWTDYGFNLKLFQYGGFISRIDSLNNGILENTLAFFEQSNNFKTDRRFLYFQHINSAIPKITFFASIEADIYKKVKGISKNEISLTSLYLSARYSPSRIVSFSTSYDARKNVIYYETFKNLADSIIDAETRQGFKIQSTLRPINYMFISIDWGYRFKSGDYKSSRNFGGRISYSRIPVIYTSATASFTRLITSYADGYIYGFYLLKNINNPTISLGLGFRKVDYKLMAGSFELKQNIITFDASYNIMKNISLSASYENTFEKKQSYSRVYFNINTSF